jgi:hypothetical protein
LGESFNEMILFWMGKRFGGRRRKRIESVTKDVAAQNENLLGRWSLSSFPSSFASRFLDSAIFVALRSVYGLLIFPSSKLKQKQRHEQPFLPLFRDFLPFLSTSRSFRFPPSLSTS